MLSNRVDEFLELAELVLGDPHDLANSYYK
jgi:hypothetical protein